MSHPGTGRFVLSVDISSNEKAAAQFLKRLQRYKIRATWGCPDLSSEFVQELTDQGQDLALLVPQDDESSQRSWLAPWLEEQVELVRHRGLQLTTLALTNPASANHLDLLVRHRIRVVRVPKSSGRSLHAGSVRYGIWVAQPNMVLGEGSSWTTNRWSVHRSVRRSVANGSVLHVWLQADDLGNTPVSRIFNQVMDGVEKQLQSGRLSSDTLSDLAAELAPSRRPAGQSILRAA